MTTVSVLGSTGSIGTQTLDVIATTGDRFQVAALAARRSVDLWPPRSTGGDRPLAVIGDTSRYAEARRRLPPQSSCWPARRATRRPLPPPTSA